MIYLPIDDLSSNACYVVRDKDTIRAFKNQPTLLGGSFQYTDYFINSHYIFNTGTQNFTTNSQLPNCMPLNNFTNNIYYRTDMPEILLMFLIICIFAFYLPFKILKSFFKKGV